ncbi:MAG: putative copper export protein [Paracoccaceae bacterium]|jgi:putative copper export protein
MVDELWIIPVGPILLVCGLLGPAAVNKLRLVPAMRAGDTKAFGKLALSIKVETRLCCQYLRADRRFDKCGINAWRLSAIG